MARQARHSRHYGWVIFGLSFLNLVTEGGLKNTVPVLYVALRDSFHWSAARTSSVFSLAGLVGALGAPLLGRLSLGAGEEQRWAANVSEGTSGQRLWRNR